MTTNHLLTRSEWDKLSHDSRRKINLLQNEVAQLRAFVAVYDSPADEVELHDAYLKLKVAVPETE